jgi:hypothetical protein
MAIIQQYPLKTPKNSDLLVGTSIPDPNTNDDPKTSSFSVSSIGSFLITENNIITGSGTFETIPLWTPNGQKIGDSIITQSALGQGVNVAGQLDVASDFYVTGSTQLNSTLTVEEVATFNDEIECNNNVTVQGIFTADGNSVFEGQASFQSSVIDVGSNSGTAGQVLSSTGTNVQWVDSIETAQITVTNAQIQTLGTVPVEILPGVSGYIYEVLGVTTTSINSGGLGDSYDWSASGDGVFYGQGFLSTQYRVEIPTANLPGGGPLVTDTYIATTLPGTFRHDSPLRLSTTLGIDPTIPVGQTPVANWVINITYRLIQVE